MKKTLWDPHNQQYNNKTHTGQLTLTTLLSPFRIKFILISSLVLFVMAISSTSESEIVLEQCAIVLNCAIWTSTLLLACVVLWEGEGVLADLLLRMFKRKMYVGVNFFLTSPNGLSSWIVCVTSRTGRHRWVEKVLTFEDNIWIENSTWGRRCYIYLSISLPVDNLVSV